VTRVFAVDNVRRGEEFERSTREITEISKRRRDEDQLASLHLIHVDFLVWLATRST
jgi:hypothetical protein